MAAGNMKKNEYSFWSPFAPLPRAKHQCIHALFPFSFSLQTMTSVSSMCGKKSGPLASERDTDPSAVYRGYFKKL